MGTKLVWGGRVISGLLACLLTMSAAMKLVGGRKAQPVDSGPVRSTNG